MGLITTADLRRGVHLELEGDPYTVVEMEKHAPTARGGKTLIRVKVRNLKTGQLINRAFKAGETFGEPDLERQDATFTYRTHDALVFMDSQTFEQLEVPATVLGDEARFVSIGLAVRIRRYRGEVIAVELPQYVDWLVQSVVPGTRGDTANRAVTTEATLQNGETLQVPLYIRPGDRVRVDPKTGEFRERAEN
jgi:elongation factor P